MTRRTYWEVLPPGKDSGQQFDGRAEAFAAAIDTLEGEGKFQTLRRVKVDERVRLEGADICTRRFTVMVEQQAVIREPEPVTAGISADYAESAE